MPGSSDGTVEIHIAGLLDSSLEASTANAVAQLDELVASAEASLTSLSTAIAEAQDKSAAPNKKGDANKGVEEARRTADGVAQIWKQVADKGIEGEEKANATSLALGKESVDAWKNQALAIEKAREDADAGYLQARIKNDAGNTVALAKDLADQQLLAVESANRRAAIDDQYEEKKRQLDDRGFADFERNEENKVKAAQATNAQLVKSGRIAAPQADTSDLQSLDVAKDNVDKAFATLTVGWDQESQAYKTELEKRVGFDQWYAEQKKAIDGKLTQDNAAQWTATDQVILSGESQLVSDIFSKRQSLAADLAQVGNRMLEQEVANDLKALTEHEMANLEMVASDRSASEEGLLFKLGAYLLDKTGLVSSEAAKTTEVAAGSSARISAQSAADATGKAEQSAANVASAESNAAVAASGAASSVASIPYVGWMMAEPVAAETFAAIQAYAGMAAFASGADNIPHDMVAQIHKGEMIIPAGSANALRSGQAGFNAGFNASAMQGGDIYNRSDATTHQWNYAPQISGIPERNVMDELRGSASEFASFVMGLQRSGAMRFA